ncbi:glycosyltransferase family 4 protein [Agrococcus baldri]|uniref:D-inositol 3-phosphate glycosyltransferase n=1 Tax=Agrococcus baldri TaxID=153730 RepID=A0AA87RFD0_9MICO|nr:glycosyltransferase family 4 protein [Agrococcus baldri]GEK79689.1 glycosyltransferase WbuB [Agrococcus baldri]
MRILLLTHYFEPENGAPQRRWSALITRFRSAGHSIDVLAPPPHYPSGRLSAGHRGLTSGTRHESASGATVHRVAFLRHSGDVATRTLDHLVAAMDSYRRGVRLFRAPGGRPDVIIATAPAMESLIAGRALARKFRVPLVAEMRDAWPDLVAHTPGLGSPATPTSAAKRRVHEFITRLQRHADVVVTTTTTFAKVLRARGISRVTVLRNGTDPARYEVVPTRVRDGKFPLRVLYMGTIGRSQGLDRVIEAVARLHATGIAIDAKLVGQGADVGRLRRLNQRLGGPVDILGQIEGAAVVEQYKWADSTIVSLRDWEPFAWTVPSKLYELMSAGKHITAIVSGESADLIRESRSGDIVEPGDIEALVALWRGIARDRTRLQVGDGGRRWITENASYDRIAQEYIKTLEEVVLSPIRRN